MKKLIVLSLATLFIASTSCKKVEDDPDTSTSAYKTMTTYMVDNGMDLPAIIAPGWIVSAPASADLQAFLDAYDIIDIRSATDFAAGHIEGAVNSPLANVLTAAVGSTKPILVVCYSGQGAGHAVVALRLSGYPDAKVLKWGMSGWRSDLDEWTAKTGDIAIGNPNWSTTNTTMPSETFSDPTLTEAGTGEALLAARVKAMLDGNFSGVASADVLATPSNYFINNFWPEADVDNYGHIVGAYRVQPLSIAGGQMSNLDPSKELVTYCWTGQTSSMVTAYLKVLGFNSTSLKNGVNSMIYSNLTDHEWSAPAEDLPVVQ